MAPSFPASRGGRLLAAASVAAGVSGVLLLTSALGGEAPPAPPASSARPSAEAPGAAPSTPEPSAASPSAVPAAPETEQVPQDVLPASAPTRVRVPALGVDTALVTLGLEPSGAMQVPDGGADVGWYDRSPTPGQVGPTVLAGHVSWDGEPGVFFDLGGLAPGELVDVTRTDGATVTYRVTGVEQYPKDAFPTLEVYGNTPGPELRLITCGGSFDDASGHHRDNVVVYAEMVGSTPA